MLLDESEVNIEDRDGTLKYYDDKATGSGNSVFRYFCSADGKYVPPSSSSLSCDLGDVADDLL